VLVVTDGAPKAVGTAELRPRRPSLLGRILFAPVRVAMLIGIASLVAAATILLVLGGISTARFLISTIAVRSVEMSNRELFLTSIKLVDLVLLATILEVVAIGLYSLFIDDDIPAPRWLRTSSVDSLKNKLAGIIAVMLGVLFLEQMIMTEASPDLLPLGIGVAAVMLALTFFIRSNSGPD
jgi:uncharacterized membrane protein YqhA